MRDFRFLILQTYKKEIIGGFPVHSPSLKYSNMNMKASDRRTDFLAAVKLALKKRLVFLE